MNLLLPSLISCVPSAPPRETDDVYTDDTATDDTATDDTGVDPCPELLVVPDANGDCVVPDLIWGGFAHDGNITNTVIIGKRPLEPTLGYLGAELDREGECWLSEENAEFRDRCSDYGVAAFVVGGADTEIVAESCPGEITGSARGVYNDSNEGEVRVELSGGADVGPLSVSMPLPGMFEPTSQWDDYVPGTDWRAFMVLDTPLVEGEHVEAILHFLEEGTRVDCRFGDPSDMLIPGSLTASAGPDDTLGVLRIVEGFTPPEEPGGIGLYAYGYTGLVLTQD